MPTDARTTNRNYPKPHPDNRVSEDFARLIDALDAIDDDVDSALDQVAGKAAATHSHPISDVTGLQGALDNKAALGHTHTLDELSDVNVAGASNGQFLQRIAGNWQPAFLGNLDASVITTGTLDPARIPVLTGQAPIVSSGAISALTVPQQAQVITGTIVVTTDGFRWVYSGSGSKTDQASYISLADITPDWAVIANKPSTFPPETHTHTIGDITGLLATIAAAVAAAVPTGVVDDFIGSTAPAGWLLLDGRTIGSAASGATARANADTQALYELLWATFANAQAPVSGGRGASAVADFSANKTLTLPDARGRAIFGRDNMGGTAANRLTAAGSGIDGTVMGNSGGAQSHTLTSAEMPVHSHSGTTASAGDHTHTVSGATNPPQVNMAAIFGSDPIGFASSQTTSSGGAHTHSFTTGNAGSGGAHNNMPPALVLSKIIKL